MVLVFATLLTMCCCHAQMRIFPTNYLILLMLTVGLGGLVGYTTAWYTWQSVVLALGVTAGIFFSLTIFACKTKKDFTGMGPYLYAALNALCLMGFAIAIISYFTRIVWMYMLYDSIGVVLFSFYIVYDTQVILGQWGGHKVALQIDDYVLAALTLYLDILNIFLFILSMFGQGRR
eukprot:NODE_3822_length_739_cov_459.586257.p1 GENE.NODE_3822_length_739_cov_459.586257~~NODE_3822_length_739_cov_459.586257.p1  ORF type:complete len:194 (+),score=63.54 NODE_3822_length_739_cov_459.586257:56-583(+)